MNQITVYQGPYVKGPPPQEFELAHRLSRHQGLFAPELLKGALKKAFVMLRPDIQWKNPVIFVVKVTTVLTGGRPRVGGSGTGHPGRRRNRPRRGFRQ